MLLVPALALGACGGGDDAEDQIRGIIDDVSKKPATLCENATEGLLKQVGSTEEACKQAASGQRPDRKVEIRDIKVDGDRATAMFKGTDGDRIILFEKEDGDWKVSDVQ
jgi:hypothetical protein